MELKEKTRIRLAHWIEHNVDHLHEYERIAFELQNAGYTESARQIDDMSVLVMQINIHLKKAVEALGRD